MLTSAPILSFPPPPPPSLSGGDDRLCGPDSGAPHPRWRWHFLLGGRDRLVLRVLLPVRWVVCLWLLSFMSVSVCLCLCVVGGGGDSERETAADRAIAAIRQAGLLTRTATPFAPSPRINCLPIADWCERLSLSNITGLLGSEIGDQLTTGTAMTGTTSS